MSNRKLVKVITMCPECGSGTFYVDKFASKNAQCKECGVVTKFTELFTAYTEVREVLTYE